MTRRAALISQLVSPLAVSSIAAQVLAPREFWKEKQSSDWTAAENAQLTSASPWAIRTRAGMTGSFMGKKSAEPRSHLNSTAPIAFYGEVVVSWESAAPLILARNAQLPAEFDHHYALRVTGLPAETFMPESGRSPVLFRLLIGTTLEASSGRRVQSDYVLRLPEEKSILFAFPVHRFPLRFNDQFVTFAMNLNQMMVRARFDLRQMTFEKTMAV